MRLLQQESGSLFIISNVQNTNLPCGNHVLQLWNFKNMFYYFKIFKYRVSPQNLTVERQLEGLP